MPSEAFYMQEDIDRWDDEDYLRELQRERDERVCDLWSPMWFTENDLSNDKESK